MCNNVLVNCRNAWYNKAILEKVPEFSGTPGKEEMTVAERKNSEARIRANNKYNEKAYDRINIAIPKGRKDTIKAHADIRGESINAFIGRAIQETMERDTGAAGGPQEAGVVSLPPDTLKAAQEAAEAAGEGLPQFITRAISETVERQKEASK